MTGCPAERILSDASLKASVRECWFNRGRSSLDESVIQFAVPALTERFSSALWRPKLPTLAAHSHCSGHGTWGATLLSDTSATRTRPSRPDGRTDTHTAHSDRISSRRLTPIPHLAELVPGRPSESFRPCMNAVCGAAARSGEKWEKNSPNEFRLPKVSLRA